jgi:hypothetical protein
MTGAVRRMAGILTEGHRVNAGEIEDLLINIRVACIGRCKPARITQ